MFFASEARALGSRWGEEITWIPRSNGGNSLEGEFPNIVLDHRSQPRKLLQAVHHFPLRAFLFELRILLKRRAFRKILRLLLAALDAGSRCGLLISLPASSIYYSYWSSVDGMSALLAAKKTGAKSIVRNHGSDFYLDSDGDPRPFVSYLHAPDSSPTLHVYLSEKARAYASANFGSAPSLVSPIGISLEKRDDTGLASTLSGSAPFTLVSASTSSAVKRLRLISEVFHGLAEVGILKRWIHFGCSAEELSLAAQIDLAGERNIECRGSLTNAEFRANLELLSDAVFINLSSSEGLPVTLLEASAAGLPVIATDVGSVADLIDESTGLLLSPELGATSAIRAIESWLLKGGLLEKAQRASQRVAQNYNESEANARIVTTIEGILSSAGAE